ncbi:MAG TPA: RluA family pseudouridine synthase [Thermoanaerobaculales bacterium]|nr:RluA family pseudouridine synthase [Thermoanaerobaculales bacterium]HPA79311.1 RluA family pseudouridine synthase [Thermoanaerobaculales bacterium]HQL31281.1 RluA family pseudouridine synthase [Thermoanaerobaculales bacterium]HQN96150.1 RluA family pseudouridine synthase [Thermoanaerobaculales bacterium]HQP42648.1 RluA family pseudouridine synthase [Thermoanaerobaculales bacterium]
MSPLHRFSVPDRLAGERLDRCVAELHGQWSRSRVRRLLDDGRVLVNDQPAKPATIVAAGDRIEVDEPPLQPLGLAAEDIPLVILHEDEALLVLDKPPGLVIHPATGNRSGTLVNALLRHCSTLSGIGGVERPGIVHRLDKDTSGLMVVAKTERAHLSLSLAFRRREVEKRYLAVCFGAPAEPAGVIEGAVGRHPTERKRMAVVESGRPARTLYTVIERLSGTSLVECRPVTGRTHQIRVHLAHIGHALVGDQTYAGRQWRNLEDPRQRAACRDFPRQALHAWRLAFLHPVTGERHEFEAPPPADFLLLVEALRPGR